MPPKRLPEERVPAAAESAEENAERQYQPIPPPDTWRPNPAATTTPATTSATSQPVTQAAAQATFNALAAPIGSEYGSVSQVRTPQNAQNLYDLPQSPLVDGNLAQPVAQAASTTSAISASAAPRSSAPPQYPPPPIPRGAKSATAAPDLRPQSAVNPRDPQSSPVADPPNSAATSSTSATPAQTSDASATNRPKESLIYGTLNEAEQFKAKVSGELEENISKVAKELKERFKKQK